MEAILHKANTRGITSNEWLESFHTFSFGRYSDVLRKQFGALRVLNDDTVAPGAGFGKHGHMNMEIISIPLHGELEHEDNMGNQLVICEGDVQVMSAGTGITHSEKNKNEDQFVKFLQIWIKPFQQNTAPRYDQKTFHEKDRRNKLVTIVSPMGENEGLNIYQDAWLSMGRLDKGTTLDYHIHKKGNGVYLFVLEGDAMGDEFVLNRRDGLGLMNRNSLTLKGDSDAEVLLIEVPMTP